MSCFAVKVVKLLAIDEQARRRRIEEDKKRRAAEKALQDDPEYEPTHTDSAPDKTAKSRGNGKWVGLKGDPCASSVRHCHRVCECS